MIRRIFWEGTDSDTNSTALARQGTLVLISLEFEIFLSILETDERSREESNVSLSMA